jgi:hypothetical protein
LSTVLCSRVTRLLWGIQRHCLVHRPIPAAPGRCCHHQPHRPCGHSTGGTRCIEGTTGVRAAVQGTY